MLGRLTVDRLKSRNKHPRKHHSRYSAWSFGDLSVKLRSHTLVTKGWKSDALCLLGKLKSSPTSPPLALTALTSLECEPEPTPLAGVTDWGDALANHHSVLSIVRASERKCPLSKSMEYGAAVSQALYCMHLLKDLDRLEESR